MTAGEAGIPRNSVLSTLAVVVLSTVSSALGLLREDHYAVDPSLVPRLQAQDAVVLAVAVPVLAVALWAARRGSLRGRVAWLGALAFMTYTWASVAGQAGFTQFFLGHLALFALSLFTLVAGLARTDAAAVRRELDGELSGRLYGGFLAFVAVGLSALWLAELVPATATGTPPLVLRELGPQAVQTYVLDLGVVVPSLALTAVLLWRNRAWGYVFSGVLLVMAALLAPTLTAVTVVDATGGYLTLSLPLVAGTVVPPLVAAAFAVQYLRHLGPMSAPDGRRGVQRESA